MHACLKKKFGQNFLVDKNEEDINFDTLLLGLKLVTDYLQKSIYIYLPNYIVVPVNKQNIYNKLGIRSGNNVFYYHGNADSTTRGPDDEVLVTRTMPVLSAPQFTNAVTQEKWIMEKGLLRREGESMEKAAEAAAIEQRYQGYSERTFPVAVIFLLPDLKVEGGQ